MLNRLLREDRGSVAIEVAILAPVLLGLIALGVVAGRTTLAANAVAAAAHDGARAASLARSPGSAQADAARSADITLGGRGRSCLTHTTRTDAAGFFVPVGQPATVTVTVTCQVSYADMLGVPGIPGGRTISESFTSPLDTFRGRSG